MNKRKSILIALALILLSGGVFASGTFKQKVSWTPETLNLPSLKPGESTTTSVVLMNASLLSNQKIEGEHLAFTTTNPNGATITATANFPKKIAPGEKVTVTLVISVASSTLSLPPRVISGTVQLVKKDDDNDKKDEKDDDKEKVKLFGKSLTVNIAVSSIPLPPFPNKAEDEKTIAGLDADANSVPDRVEWFIATAAPDSEKKRAAMMLSAKAEQFFLLDYLVHKNDDPAALEARVKGNSNVGIKTLNCRWYVFGANLKLPGGQEAMDAVMENTSELLALFYNTPDRLRNFKDAERSLVATGGVTSSFGEDKQQCLDLGFDPDSLPN